MTIMQSFGDATTTTHSLRLIAQRTAGEPTAPDRAKTRKRSSLQSFDAHIDGPVTSRFDYSLNGVSNSYYFVIDRLRATPRVCAGSNDFEGPGHLLFRIVRSCRAASSYTLYRDRRDGRIENRVTRSDIAFCAERARERSVGPQPRS
jgi:hypothetical protein